MNKEPKALPAKRSRGKPGTVTIRDIARRAGVSTATVSRTLASPGVVASETRQAVMEAITKTGFAPNASARNLRARSTKMVLALLPGIGTTFYTPILHEIEDVLALAGYGVVVGDTRMDRSREAHYHTVVRTGQVDGVMLFAGRLPHPDFARVDAAVPIVLVCNDIPDVRGLPVIEIDNHYAAHTIVDYLIGLGHRRIAHCIGPADNIEAIHRLDGYRSALADAGLPIDESLIWQGAFDLGAGVRCGQHFLSLAQRPTAVFAANDAMAIGFIKTVKDAGVQVPGDVSVAGFDDIEYARYFEPAITTMSQPRAELGRLAAESLLARMTGKRVIVPLRTRLPCTLMVRASVKSPRA